MSSTSEGFIRTVTGDVRPKALGHTQCHEHIWLRKGPSFLVNPALCMEDHDRSLAELKTYREAGGGTIVDAQPGGFGRDSAMLRQLSEESGVLIVSVTGFHKLCFLEPEDPLLLLDEDALTERFVRDVTDSPVPAGLIKGALVPGWENDRSCRRLFMAAARAAAKTGAPVMIHTEKGADVLPLMDFFGRYQVAPERMILCHLDRTWPDAAYHMKVLSAGCTLCYDSIRREKYISEEEELSLLRAVCGAGFSDRVVLSLDTTNLRLRSYFSPDMGLDYILTVFREKLKRSGFSEREIRRMTAENAANVLQIQVRR